METERQRKERIQALALEAIAGGAKCNKCGEEMSSMDEDNIYMMFPDEPTSPSDFTFTCGYCAYKKSKARRDKEKFPLEAYTCCRCKKDIYRYKGERKPRYCYCGGALAQQDL